MSTTIAFKDGDFWFEPNGQGMTISDSDKADQDIAETLLQPYDATDGSGNEIPLLVGNPLIMSSPDAATGIVAHKLREAIQRLQSKQNSDPALDPGERIVGINRLVVKPGTNMGDFLYYVEAALANGDVVTGAKGFKVSLKQAELPK